jgi:hypothetical protein
VGTGCAPRADLHQVPQDLFDLGRISDHGNHIHGCVAAWTLQRIDFITFANAVYRAVVQKL